MKTSLLCLAVLAVALVLVSSLPSPTTQAVPSGSTLVAASGVGICLATPVAVEPAEGLLYECPMGVPYCQRDKQCESYCGPGGEAFAVCEFGCCACAG